jgi:hypothetical protein
MGIRQKLAEEFGSTPNKDGNLGKQHAENVIVSPLRSESYHEDLASSVFCGVMPGDGWSGRMEDSILQGCIPVVIQVGSSAYPENVENMFDLAYKQQATWLFMAQVSTLKLLVVCQNCRWGHFMLSPSRTVAFSNLFIFFLFSFKAVWLGSRAGLQYQ